MNENYLIVGGTTGIGAALVNKLMQREHHVYLLSRHPERAPQTPLVTSNRWNLKDDPFPLKFLPDSLAGLVYCPGTIRLKPFSRLQENDFKEDLEINLMGAVKAIQGSLPSLRQAKSASITLFSTVAVQTGMAYHASIASAKGAVEGLVRSLAAELAPGIRVNALALSLVDTELAERLLNSAEKRSMAEARHPLKRIGTAEDVASAIDWLLHDPWITGQVIPLDGGLSSLRLFS